MGFSSIVSLAIVFATAATLNANGITDIETSAQAAEALRPIAGQFAFALFALGIIGTGLLAVPVLAGSAAYAVTEMVGKVGSLDAKPLQARLFYATIAVTTLRSEEHTSELQSLMRISYAVFCLKKKKKNN